MNILDIEYAWFWYSYMVLEAGFQFRISTICPPPQQQQHIKHKCGFWEFAWVFLLTICSDSLSTTYSSSPLRSFLVLLSEHVLVRNRLGDLLLHSMYNICSATGQHVSERGEVRPGLAPNQEGEPTETATAGLWQPVCVLLVQSGS